MSTYVGDGEGLPFLEALLKEESEKYFAGFKDEFIRGPGRDVTMGPTTVPTISLKIPIEEVDLAFILDKPKKAPPRKRVKRLSQANFMRQLEKVLG